MSRPPWRFAAASWFAALVATLLLLAALAASHLLAADDRVLLHMAQLPQGSWLDAAMFGTSLLGALEVTVPLAAVLTLLAWRARASHWWVPLTLFVVADLVEYVAKQAIPQMPVPLGLQRGPHFGAGVATAFSFPSGHMTRATMLLGWVALALFARRPRAAWLWACIGMTWVIGYSRVYLGSHWPTDVAGGILLGGAALALSLATAPGAVLLLGATKEEDTPPTLP